MTAASGALWATFGIVAGVVFYTRFYVQWIASEIKKRSVVPPLFWYQSAFGSVMLLVWAMHTQSPLGALSQSVNMLPYARNLVHVWREKRRLSVWASLAMHGAAALIVAFALAVTMVLWRREYAVSQMMPTTEVKQTWFWLGAGLIGQGLFGIRFLVQWIATERARRSIVPTMFWNVSLIAALLQIACFTQRREWVFAAGMLANALIYLRNLWFIHAGTRTGSRQTGRPVRP